MSPLGRASGAIGSRRRGVRSKADRSTTSCSTISPKSRCRFCRSRERDPGWGTRATSSARSRACCRPSSERGVRVIANAGGVNPVACAKRSRAGRLARRGGTRSHRCRHRRRPAAAARRPHRARPRSRTWTRASRSPGPRPRALRQRVHRIDANRRSARRDAQVVVTGRSTDTALTMAPLRHEFGWAADDWESPRGGDRRRPHHRVRRAVLGGTACSTGATFGSRERRVSDRQRPPDGTFEISKHPGTGGRISVPTVTEQLVYEMGDPHSYITPDVVADFTTIQLESAGSRSRVGFGIGGGPPTDKLKVSIAYRAGSKRSARSSTRGRRHSKGALADRVLASGSTDSACVRQGAHRVRRRVRCTGPLAGRA